MMMISSQMLRSKNKNNGWHANGDKTANQGNYWFNNLQKVSLKNVTIDEVQFAQQPLCQIFGKWEFLKIETSVYSVLLEKENFLSRPTHKGNVIHHYGDFQDYSKT